jgi:anaerobic magnesium-protoporphyrin IX monomethyl ester cyclase
MKIILLATRSPEFVISDPAPLLHVARLPLQKGHTVKIIQSEKFNNHIKELEKELVDTDILGVSCLTSPSILEGVEATRLCRMVNRKCLIVWGGYHASLEPEQALQVADIVVMGQGEITFDELIYQLEHPLDKSLHDINGLAFRHFHGKQERIIITPPRKFEDINNFPRLPFHLIDVNRNVRASHFGLKTFKYLSSQGCFHRCEFCVEPAMSGRRWSGLNAKRVVDDIEYLISNYDIDSIQFIDPDFFAVPKRVTEICKELIDRKLNIIWGDAEGRSRQMLKMSDETWELMRQSGCKCIFFGAESALDEGLAAAHKDTSVQDNIDLIKKADKFNINITCGTIVGFPYPGKTIEELREITKKEYKALLGFMKHVFIRPENKIGIFCFMPYPKAGFWEACLKLGIERPEKLEDWAKFNLQNSLVPWIPKDLAKEIEIISDYVQNWTSKRYLNYLAGNRLYHSLGYIVYFICKLRWHYNFYKLPLDFYIFKLIMRLWSRK